GAAEHRHRDVSSRLAVLEIQSRRLPLSTSVLAVKNHSPCLVLDRVSRAFGGLTAVDDVSLTLVAGERRAVIGPNGAGKTTLFNIISGELAATKGAVRLFDEDVTRLAPHQRAAR